MLFCSWKDLLSAPEFVVNLLLSTKHKDWSYEGEQRIISHRHEGNQAIDITEIQLELTAVYLGTRFHDTSDKDGLYERLMKHCSVAGIPIKNLHKNSHSYKLRVAEDDPVHI